MACPICRCDQFYIKDDDDQYETHEFTAKPDGIRFEECEKDASQLAADCEVFCTRCAWHGPLNQVAQKT